MPDVAPVTYGELPDLNPDDHPLRAALTAGGARAHAVRWDDAGVDRCDSGAGLTAERTVLI